MRDKNERASAVYEGVHEHCERVFSKADRSSRRDGRLIAVDTETTGLSPQDGHRIIEIGCIEIRRRRPTGTTFHRYIDPERAIDQEAQQVHGITAQFLADKPKFREIATEFLSFVDGAELIIHNADFDIGFLNHELVLADINPADVNRYCKVTDSLRMARQMHPGQRNSLDALCRRYRVDASHRRYHGALLDAELLARVYLRMTGGQPSLLSENAERAVEAFSGVGDRGDAKTFAPTPSVCADEAELDAHRQFMRLLSASQQEKPS